MQLNPKEQRILDYIRSVTESEGYPPSVRDIMSALHYRSPSTVQMYLDRLESFGCLTREKGKNRSLRLTDDVRGRVPLLGTVTAGVPILAEESFEGYINYTAGHSGYRQDNLFALRVKGESMIEAGILDGDVVIVDKRDYAENGEIVVALIDDEATVKEFYKEQGHFRLQPRNPTMRPILTDHVSVLGKVIADIRYYG